MATALRVVEAHDPQAWNAAMLRSPGADLLQGWEWGEFKRLSGGWKPLRVLAERDGEPVAGVQLLSRRVMGAPSLYAPRGPWWLDEEGVNALVRWLRRKLAWRAPFLRTDPLIEDAAPLMRLGFRRAPRQVQPRATIIVDLTRGEEAILNGYDRQVRYNVRLAERKGVVVTRGGRESIEEFWKLLSATATRKGFAERDLSYFEHLVAVYGDAAPLFLARRESELLYGALVVACGPFAYYLYGASGGDRSAKPSELVQYQAMCWAKRRGVTRYDMWGIPAHPTEDNPLYGVYRFKHGFGGQTAFYAGALDLPLIPVVGRASGALETLALKSLSLAHGEGFRLVDHLA
ncbi:MAG: peptidoglycan bridge formation glycyltransferase FemA/FemB family protein [Ktedonobacterales bacterium]|nr:peptidoglycan bridge formation glycyltransferase FemA/FemB family protein [Ktedonobacterales bacterium]